MSFRAAKCGSRFFGTPSSSCGNLVPDCFRRDRNPMGALLDGGGDGLRVLLDNLAGGVSVSRQRVRRYSFFRSSGQ